MRGEEFITKAAAVGRHHFTTEDLVRAGGGSLPSVQAMLRRLRNAGAVATPHRGFHVVVPPEYRVLGCLPPEQFLPQLMEHLRAFYYVGLLSAARYHGAAHQQPQVFQAAVSLSRPPISCGKVRVDFFARANAAAMPTRDLVTPRGYLRVSSPEGTAFDLVGYMHHAGGIDNVATVLQELTDVLDPERLASVAALSPVAWAQRLGYLLEHVGAGKLAGLLRKFVRREAREYRSLVPGPADPAGQRSADWRLLLNADVEADL